MNTVWFRELGFYSNPFSIKPAVFHDQMIGFETMVDEISYGILNNKIVVIDSDYGNGKSSILKRILNDFGGKKKVIYYSCNRMDGRLDIKTLLNDRYGFFGKWFDVKPKDMILLLDEAQELGGKDYERIYPYYQEGFIKSVVLVGKGIKTEQIVAGLKNNLTEISLGKLNEEQALQIIKKRIGELPLLPDFAIRKIYQKSNGNVRVMLKICEEVCKSAMESGRKKVSEEYLKAYFSEAGEEKPKEEKKPVEKKEVKAEKPAKEVKVEKKNPPKGRVYRPDDYNVLKRSAEEMLNKSTDEIFGDEQYY
jgi:Cdc6-like AAA superfamily ATPase